MATASTPKSSKPNYDLPLPPDVLAILDKHRYFFREPCKNPPILKGAVTVPTSSPGGTAIKITPIKLPEDGKFDEQPIEYDPSHKKLQTCPKRVGSA